MFIAAIWSCFIMFLLDIYNGVFCIEIIVFLGKMELFKHVYTNKTFLKLKINIICLKVNIKIFILMREPILNDRFTEFNKFNN